MLSNEKFNEKLLIDNFKELEEAFQDAKKTFKDLKEKIKCNEVEVKFPGYCFNNKEILLRVCQVIGVNYFKFYIN